jgi:predicted ribonuclease YlaK
MIKFYDTSALLEQIPNEYFYISIITLQELENIKTAYNKDYEIKQKARHVSNWLSEHMDGFKAVKFTPHEEKVLSNDEKILYTACGLAKRGPLTFYTNDNNLFLQANSIGLNVEKIKINQDDYNGIYEVTLTDTELAEYYSNLHNNIFNLYKGQYLIIKNQEGEVIDKACWTGSEMRPVAYDDIVSGAFGRLKPKKDDPYQACLFDSLQHNKVNVITGPAGSGKSLLGLAYLFSQLGKTIDRIVIFCNPVVVRNASKLGFYPGSVLDKLLSTQMGNILSSKLGDKIAVEGLINEGKLILIPVGDCRGYEVPPCSGVFITEGQNFSIDLLRLILSRCADDSIVVCEGDAKEQTDIEAYAGSNSGIREMSRVFRGSNIFGQVELKNIYRSEIARVADRMGRS